MSNSITIALFGSFDANDRVHSRVLKWELGKPQRVRPQYGGPGVDIAVAGPVDESAWAIARWTIELSDTSGDGVSARVAALAAELRDLSAITVGMPNSAYTGTLTPKNAECLERPITAISPVAFAETVEVIVEREAWVYGATETPYDAEAVTIPCVLSLAAMLGDAPAPLNLLLEATAADLHQVVAGVYPDAPAALEKFVLEAVDLSWSAGAADTDANGYPDGAGNTVWKTNAAAGVYTDVDVTDYLPGTYALYANVKRDAGASPATIETPYTDPVTIEGTDLRRQLVGIVSLPCATVRGAATSTLRLTMKGDDTDYVYCNTLEIIPVSWGYVGWHHTTPGSSADTLRFADGLVYADDAASLAYAIDPTSLLALGGTLVIIGEGTAEAPTQAAETTVSYEPRWEQLPTSGIGAGPGI